MNLTIELPDEIAAVLRAHAEAQGVSAARFARRVIERSLTPSVDLEDSSQPFETGRGMFAKYGAAPSAEEIDANRADMLRNFPKDVE
jgi:hypothetical protein